jgi:sugar (pentulose or hexulose) kinase
MSIAVIDIGKTNAKVVLVSAHGEELDERRMPNSVLAGPPYPHFDTDALWQFILGALRDFAPSITAIVPVTHGACAALVDADGELVLPVLDYEFDGPDGTRANYEPPDFTQTGSPVLPGGLNVGAQLHYLETSFPQQIGEARQLLFWPQYWAFRLTGVASTELTSLGCHTDLWNVLEATPSSLAVQRGWNRLLPPLRGATSTLGTVLPEIARSTGLDDQTAVHTGVHDSNASLIPYLSDAPCTVVSTGTWVIILALEGGAAHLDPTKDMLINVAVNGSLVPSARFMGGRQRSEAISDGMEPRDADCILAERTAVRIAELEGQGPIFVEGASAANTTYLKVLSDISGMDVKACGNGAGTTRGAAMLVTMRGMEEPKQTPF